jgi:GTP cyclohydrolase I
VVLVLFKPRSPRATVASSRAIVTSITRPLGGAKKAALLFEAHPTATRFEKLPSLLTSWTHRPKIDYMRSPRTNEPDDRLAAADQGSLPGEEDGGAGRGKPAKVDQSRIARAVREILTAVGEDPDREGLVDTPDRVARMYAELFAGLHEDPRVHLRKFFAEKYDEIVLVRDISFNSMCEHHMLPFMGQAHIGYLPNGRVVGLSKLARVVETVARRPQVQERMTETIANLLEEELKAKGVAVVIEATHTCMTIRGIRKPGSLCVTSAMKGIFRSNLSSRSEVMNLIYGGRR